MLLPNTWAQSAFDLAAALLPYVAPTTTSIWLPRKEGGGVRVQKREAIRSSKACEIGHSYAPFAYYYINFLGLLLSAPSYRHVAYVIFSSLMEETQLQKTIPPLIYPFIIIIIAGSNRTVELLSALVQDLKKKWSK